MLGSLFNKVAGLTVIPVKIAKVLRTAFSSGGIRVRISQKLEVVPFLSWNLDVMVFQSWNSDVMVFYLLKKCLGTTMT